MTKDLECDINSVDKQGLRRLAPALKEALLWVKCYQQCMLQRNHSSKKESMDTADFSLSYFKKLP